MKITFRHPSKPGDCQITSNNNIFVLSVLPAVKISKYVIWLRMTPVTSRPGPLAEHLLASDVMLPMLTVKGLLGISTSLNLIVICGGRND